MSIICYFYFTYHFYNQSLILLYKRTVLFYPALLTEQIQQ